MALNLFGRACARRGCAVICIAGSVREWFLVVVGAAQGGGFDARGRPNNYALTAERRYMRPAGRSSVGVRCARWHCGGRGCNLVVADVLHRLQNMADAADTLPILAVNPCSAGEAGNTVTVAYSTRTRSNACFRKIVER